MIRQTLRRIASAQFRVCLSVLLVALSTSACESRPAPKETAEAPEADGEGRRLFAARCSVCHGADGSGAGPGAAALNPKPRDLRLADWQASVTDEHIAKIIVEGGLSVGKSAQMPAAPDLKAQPKHVDELVRYVRSLGK